MFLVFPSDDPWVLQLGKMPLFLHCLEKWHGLCKICEILSHVQFQRDQHLIIPMKFPQIVQSGVLLGFSNPFCSLFVLI